MSTAVATMITADERADGRRPAPIAAHPATGAALRSAGARQAVFEPGL